MRAAQAALYTLCMGRLLALVLAFASLASAQAPRIVEEKNPDNTAAAQAQHYVVMVSLDGFRYDYPTLHGAPNLLDIARHGVSVPNGIVPAFRSITFPNHYTLATGLLPEHHGIVDNDFYDPDTQRWFHYKDASGSDGTFFDGVPLWSLAESQGMRSATLFWPSSGTRIANYFPSFHADHYVDSYPGEKRIDQAIEWLRLPAEERPHLIMLYFSDVDHAGHTSTPTSAETRNAVHRVDALIGDLRRRLNALHLPIDLIVTADHGMSAVVRTEPLVLNRDSAVAGAMRGVRHSYDLVYPETDAQAQRIADAINALHDPRVTAYRANELPKSYSRLGLNPREGDPILVTSGPYEVRFDPRTDGSVPYIGDHGYLPRFNPEMKAIFLAEGPDIRSNIKLPTFENVDVYDFVAKLLQLKPAANDGTLVPLQPALKH